jgi:myo-inositol-1(or 4)-monophosphatase
MNAPALDARTHDRLSAAVGTLLEGLCPRLLAAFAAPAGVDRKLDGTVVTAADTAAEAALHDGLRPVLPEAAFLGEETAPADDAAVAALFARPAVWCVDPIDGTKNFATGLPLFAVSVGLLLRGDEGHAPAFGAVLLPALGELVRTTAAGVLVKALPGGAETRVARRQLPPGVRPTLILPGSLGKHFRLAPGVPGRFDYRQFGSTVIDHLYAGLGRSAGTVTHGHLWDVAGALAVCQRLGVDYRDLTTGAVQRAFRRDDFTFGGPDTAWRLRGHYAVSDAALFPSIREAVQPGP